MASKNSNYGKPQSEYSKKLSAMTDGELFNECKRVIGLSAASNNSKDECHWQCAVCWDECENQGQIKIYKKAQNEN